MRASAWGSHLIEGPFQIVNIRSLFSRAAVAGVLTALLAGGFSAAPAFADTPSIPPTLETSFKVDSTGGLLLHVTYPGAVSDYTTNGFYVCEGGSAEACAAPDDLTFPSYSSNWNVATYNLAQDYGVQNVNGNSADYPLYSTIDSQQGTAVRYYLLATRNSDGAQLMTPISIARGPNVPDSVELGKNLDGNVQLRWSPARENEIPLVGHFVSIRLDNNQTPGHNFYFTVPKQPLSYGTVIPTSDAYSNQLGTGSLVVRQGPTPNSVEIDPPAGASSYEALVGGKSAGDGVNYGDYAYTTVNYDAMTPLAEPKIALNIIAAPNNDDDVRVTAAFPSDRSDYSPTTQFFFCSDLGGSNCSTPSDFSNPGGGWSDQTGIFAPTNPRTSTSATFQRLIDGFGRNGDVSSLYMVATRNSDGAQIVSNVLSAQAPTTVTPTLKRNADGTMRLSWNAATERGLPLRSYDLDVKLDGASGFYFNVKATPGAAGSTIRAYDVQSGQLGSWVIKQGPTATSVDIDPVGTTTTYDAGVAAHAYSASIGEYTSTGALTYATLPSTVPLVAGQVDLSFAVKPDGIAYIKGTFPDAASGYTFEKAYICAASASEPCTTPSNLDIPGSGWSTSPGGLSSPNGTSAAVNFNLPTAGQGGAGYVVFKRISDGARLVTNVLRAAKPEAPTNVKFTNNADGTVTASWDAAAEHGDPVSQYLAQVYIDGQFEFFTRVYAGSAAVAPGAHLFAAHSAQSGLGTFPWETYEVVQGTSATSFTFKPSTNGTYTFDVRARSYAGYGTPVPGINSTVSPLTIPTVPVPSPSASIPTVPVPSPSISVPVIPEPSAEPTQQPTATPEPTVEPTSTPTAEPTKPVAPAPPVTPVTNLTTTDIHSSYTATSTSGTILRWAKVKGATRYDVVLNGKAYTSTSNRLSAKVRYGLNTVKVRPANTLGVGQWSKVHKFHTVRPNAVATPIAKVAKHAVKITWFKPRDYTAADVNRYLVDVQRYAHGKWVHVRTAKVFDAQGAAQAKLSHLSAGKYRVKVKSFTTRASAKSFTSVWASGWSKAGAFTIKK